MIRLSSRCVKFAAPFQPFQLSYRRIAFFFFFLLLRLAARYRIRRSSASCFLQSDEGRLIACRSCCSISEHFVKIIEGIHKCVSCLTRWIASFACRRGRCPKRSVLLSPASYIGFTGTYRPTMVANNLYSCPGTRLQLSLAKFVERCSRRNNQGLRREACFTACLSPYSPSPHDLHLMTGPFPRSASAVDRDSVCMPQGSRAPGRRCSSA